MIEPPTENPRRAAPRVIAESLAQSFPITAGLAHLYRYTHPSEMDTSLAQWREKVSDSINNNEDRIQALEQFLRPRLIISETALEIALWIVRESQNGLKDPIQYQTLRNAFLNIDNPLLEEGCAELEHLDFISTNGAMGHPIVIIRPKYQLFWSFDSFVMNTNPTSDAVQVATLLLENHIHGMVSRIDSELEWSRRRLNPAIALAMFFVHEGRISQTLQNDYPTDSISLIHEDRFALKRFIQENSPMVS